MFTDIIAERYINELIKRYPSLSETADSIDMMYSIIKKSFFNGKKLFCCGNGGSCSDSEHVVGELMKSFVLPRPLPADLQNKLKKISGDDQLSSLLQMGLPCISLISHPSLHTAFINDVNAEMIFAQQLLVLGNEGDVLLGFSTSGGSKNVCRAFQVAKAKEMTVILMTGEKHGICENYADVTVHVPSKETYKIQEYHLPVYHCLCLMLEEAFFGNK